jgi:hypothetical protein
VLALTLPDPPPMGPLALGSFALLYSQLVLPTPSGAGAVGSASSEAPPAISAPTRLAAARRRLYTSGVGCSSASHWPRIYGWPALRQ